jgi:hypothetical protein
MEDMKMEKKYIIGIIVAVFIIAIASVGTILYVNAVNEDLYYENLENASYSQDLATKLVSKNDSTDTSFASELKNYKKDYDEAYKHLDDEEKYLNASLKYASSDSQKEYVNLLLKLNNYNKNATNTANTVFTLCIAVLDGDISYSAFDTSYKLTKIKFSNIGNDAKKVINKIDNLLDDNKDMRNKLEDIGVIRGYLGKDNLII